MEPAELEIMQALALMQITWNVTKGRPPEMKSCGA